MDIIPVDKDQRFWNIVFTAGFAVLFIFLAVIVREVRHGFPTSISFFDLALLILATFRTIRLFVYDQITQFVRDFFAKEVSGPLRAANDLMLCPWCFGMWSGLFLTFFYFVAPIAWFAILVLAISGVASFIQILINMIGWRAEELKGEVV